MSILAGIAGSPVRDRRPRSCAVPRPAGGDGDDRPRAPPGRAAHPAGRVGDEPERLPGHGGDGRGRRAVPPELLLRLAPVLSWNEPVEKGDAAGLVDDLGPERRLAVGPRGMDMAKQMRQDVRVGKARRRGVGSVPDRTAESSSSVRARRSKLPSASPFRALSRAVRPGSGSRSRASATSTRMMAAAAAPTCRAYKSNIQKAWAACPYPARSSAGVNGAPSGGPSPKSSGEPCGPPARRNGRRRSA